MPQDPSDPSGITPPSPAAAFADATTLESVLAVNLRKLMEEREMRQVDLSTLMQRHGFRWTSNTPAQVLNGYRQLSLLELVGLCAIFTRPLVDLLSGEGHVTLPTDKTTVLPLTAVRALLTAGKQENVTHTLVIKVEPTGEERLAMERLGMKIGQLQQAAHALYGTTSITEERDRRAGDPAQLERRALQAKRGHAMRAILAELDKHFSSESKPGE